MKKIRIYGCKEQEVQMIQKLASDQDIELSTIGDEDLEKTLDELFSTTSVYSENKVFTEYFAIFQGFDKEKMMEFAITCKENNLLTDAIKITETIHNKDWKCIDLLNEVKKEHELFVKSNQLSQLMKSLSQIKLDEVNEGMQKRCKDAIMDSFILLQNPKRELSQIEKLLCEIQMLLNELD